MTITELQKNEVRSILQSGQKLDAVKYLKDNFGLSLKEARELADKIEETLGDYPQNAFNRISSQQLKHQSSPFVKVFGGIFSFIGLLILGIAAYIFSSNITFIENSVLVEGEVISNPNQPIFEYEYIGAVYTYQSSVSSNPPSFSIGEKARIYINQDNPNEALVDTFTDRWFSITVLGILGGIFSFIGLGTLFFLRKM